MHFMEIKKSKKRKDQDKGKSDQYEPVPLADQVNGHALWPSNLSAFISKCYAKEAKSNIFIHTRSFYRFLYPLVIHILLISHLYPIGLWIKLQHLMHFT